MADVLGNVSFTEYNDIWRPVKKVIGHWQSGSGAYNGYAWGTTTNIFDGQVIAAITATSNTPTNAYDVYIIDADGTDVMGGSLIDRTNTSGISQIVTTKGAIAHSNLNFFVSAANTDRNGNITLYIQ